MFWQVYLDLFKNFKNSFGKVGKEILSQKHPWPLLAQSWEKETKNALLFRCPLQWCTRSSLGLPRALVLLTDKYMLGATNFCGTLCSRVSCHRCAEGFCKISNVWRCNLGNDTQLNGYLSYLYWMSMIMCIRCHWWIMINEHKYVVVQYLVLIIRNGYFFNDLWILPLLGAQRLERNGPWCLSVWSWEIKMQMNLSYLHWACRYIQDLIIVVLIPLRIWLFSELSLKHMKSHAKNQT